MQPDAAKLSELIGDSFELSLEGHSLTYFDLRISGRVASANNYYSKR